jgi:Putative zinc binding domain
LHRLIKGSNISGATNFGLSIGGVVELNTASNNALGHPQCRLCNAPLTATFVNLGMSTLCPIVLPADQINQMEPFYPLDVLVCGSCFYVPAARVRHVESIVTERGYFSSYSISWVEYARRYYEMVTARIKFPRNSRVYEIPCNKGYLLQHFVRLGIPLTSVEPAANVAAAAREKNIPTIVEFFGMDLARRLISEGKRKP